MRKGKWKLLLVLAVLLAAGIYYYVALPAINLHSSGFWIFFIVLGLLILAAYASRRQLRTVSEIRESRFMKAGLVAVGAVVLVYVVGSILSSPIVNARKYSKLLTVEERSFTEDIQPVDYSQIPLLDKDSAELEPRAVNALGVFFLYVIARYRYHANTKCDDHHSGSVTNDIRRCIHRPGQQRNTSVYIIELVNNSVGSIINIGVEVGTEFCVISIIRLCNICTRVDVPVHYCNTHNDDHNTQNQRNDRGHIKFLCGMFFGRCLIFNLYLFNRVSAGRTFFFSLGEYRAAYFTFQFIHLKLSPFPLVHMQCNQLNL